MSFITIEELKNIDRISEMAQSSQEPIFITKNGKIDLVLMSVELYEKISRYDIIDQAISEAESEIERGEEPIELEMFEKIYQDLFDNPDGFSMAEMMKKCGV